MNDFLLDFQIYKIVYWNLFEGKVYCYCHNESVYACYKLIIFKEQFSYINWETLPSKRIGVTGTYMNIYIKDLFQSLHYYTS